MADLEISEIHPYPMDGFEWIELYNSTNEHITVSRVKLYDTTGKALKIDAELLAPYSYSVATASAVLNNGGDTVLLEVDGAIIETVTYGPIEQGKSYARCDNVWLSNVVATYKVINLCTEDDATTIAHTTPNATKIPINIEPSSSLLTSSLLITPSLAKQPRRLASIDFNAKHHIGMPTPIPEKISLTSSVPTPSTTSSAPLPPTPLFAIGIFSFIQCVFLVYLILKRIRYNEK